MLLIFTIVVVVLIISVVHDLQNPRGTMRRRPSAGSWREMMDQADAADVVPDRAGKARDIPNFKAPISAAFHSFRLIFGRAIVPRSGLETRMLLSGARANERSR